MSSGGLFNNEKYTHFVCYWQFHFWREQECTEVDTKAILYIKVEILKNHNSLKYSSVENLKNKLEHTNLVKYYAATIDNAIEELMLWNDVNA